MISKPARCPTQRFGDRQIKYRAQFRAPVWSEVQVQFQVKTGGSPKPRQKKRAIWCRWCQQTGGPLSLPIISAFIFLGGGGLEWETAPGPSGALRLFVLGGLDGFGRVLSTPPLLPRKSFYFFNCVLCLYLRFISLSAFRFFICASFLSLRFISLIASYFFIWELYDRGFTSRPWDATIRCSSPPLSPPLRYRMNSRCVSKDAQLQANVRNLSFLPLFLFITIISLHKHYSDPFCALGAVSLLDPPQKPPFPSQPVDVQINPQLFQLFHPPRSVLEKL